MRVILYIIIAVVLVIGGGYCSNYYTRKKLEESIKDEIEKLTEVDKATKENYFKISCMMMDWKYPWILVSPAIKDSGKFDYNVIVFSHGVYSFRL